MKNLNKIAVMLALTFLMACGNSKNATNSTPMDNGTSSSNRDMNSKNSDGIYNSDKKASNDAMDASKNNSDMNMSSSDFDISDYDMQRRQEMYTGLNMNPDQIRRYESDSKSAMQNWKKKNKNTAMSTQDRMQQESKHLKSILDSDQYSQYEQWVTDNPYNN